MREFRFDHVAVAVRSLDPALRLFRETLGGRKQGEWRAEGWHSLQLGFPGGGKVELVEPNGEGFLTRFLERRGEGLHHVTFLTDDIEAAIKHVESSGYEVVDVDRSNPHWQEAFLRPSSAHGTVIQIAQHEHAGE
jgi:methylmalonyl-CoA epimerase